MRLCSEKLSRLEKIYSQTRQFFYEHSSYYLTKPNSLGGKTGFCILYTPPTLNADMMVVGQNPSAFTAGDDSSKVDSLTMSGKIPTINSYTNHDHKFAEKLREIFEDESQKPNILDNCVGINIWFFQATKVPPDRKLIEIKKFCEDKTRRIISLLCPKTIFACGFEAERLFREMNIEKRLKASSIDANENTLKVEFVDASLGDVHTAEESNNDIKHFT